MSELPLLVKLGSTTKERHLLIDTNQFTYICNNQNNKVAYCLCWQAKVEEDDEGDDQELYRDIQYICSRYIFKIVGQEIKDIDC